MFKATLYSFSVNLSIKQSCVCKGEYDLETRYANKYMNDLLENIFFLNMFTYIKEFSELFRLGFP